MATPCSEAQGGHASTQEGEMPDVEPGKPLEPGKTRYVVGADCRLEVWVGPTVGWIKVLGVKNVFPLLDLSQTSAPTVARIEMSSMPIVPESEA